MSTISIWKILITHQPLFFLISYLLVRKIEVFLEYFLGQKLSKTAIVGSAAADYSRLFLCEETCWVNLIIVGQPYSSPALRAQYSVARTRRLTAPRQSFAQSAGAARSDGGAPFLLHSAALRGAPILLIAAAIPIGQRGSIFIQKLQVWQKYYAWCWHFIMQWIISIKE